MSLRALAVLVLAFTVVACFHDSTKDKIDLVGHAGVGPATVLVDGRRGENCPDDEPSHGSRQIEVDNLLSPAHCRPEVLVFADSHAMNLQFPVTSWTDDGNDVLTVNMTGLINVPVVVWTMYGATQDNVLDDVDRATNLFDDERCGVEFTATITDISTATFDPTLVDASCSRLTEFKNITLADGTKAFRDGSINVYYIRTVNDAQGEWCPEALWDSILIGTTRKDEETMAHELGHALSLRHWEDTQGFEGDNLMLSLASPRNSLSIGQCFRSNESNASVLIRGKLRPGEGRDCPDDANSPECPRLAIQ